MIQKKIASIDGYSGGWIIAKADGWPVPKPVQLISADDFSDAESKTRDCSIVVVDMPIGIPDHAMRRCDRDARGAFPGLRRSIFRTPPRGTMVARDPLEFRELHLVLANGEKADFMALGPCQQAPGG